MQKLLQDDAPFDDVAADVANCDSPSCSIHIYIKHVHYVHIVRVCSVSAKVQSVCVVDTIAQELVSHVSTILHGRSYCVQ